MSSYSTQQDRNFISDIQPTFSTSELESNVDWFNVAPADGTRRGLYHCNYCQRNISTVTRIKCATCTDFDLCVNCFSVGAERYPHKASHPYHVMVTPLTPHSPHLGGRHE